MQFGDANKIKIMLESKYPISEFSVEEIRNVTSSLNNINIYDKGELSISLIPTSSGYVVQSYGDLLMLEFLADIHECLCDNIARK